jgi:hypothetical protein
MRRHYASTDGTSFTLEKEMQVAVHIDEESAAGAVQETDYTSGYVDLGGGNMRRVDTMTQPSGAKLTYEYDLLGRIHKIKSKASSAGHEYVTEYRYDIAGNLERVILPNTQEIVTRRTSTRSSGSGCA